MKAKAEQEIKTATRCMFQTTGRTAPQTVATGRLYIIGYVRVSTDKQDIGPEVQIAELQAEAARMGYDLHIVREAAASAATVAKRPLMVQALADMKAGKYHDLMVSKLDRLSRNMEDGTPAGRQPAAGLADHLS